MSYEMNCTPINSYHFFSSRFATCRGGPPRPRHWSHCCPRLEKFWEFSWYDHTIVGRLPEHGNKVGCVSLFLDVFSIVMYSLQFAFVCIYVCQSLRCSELLFSWAWHQIWKFPKRSTAGHCTTSFDTRVWHGRCEWLAQCHQLLPGKPKCLSVPFLTANVAVFFEVKLMEINNNWIFQVVCFLNVSLLN